VTSTTQGTIDAEINNSICEAVDCFAAATTEIMVRVGQQGVIPLRLCKGCVNKFAGDEETK
jgi:hypothetical protein